MGNEAWIRVQVKTFTRWANNFLSERMLRIDDLTTDLGDGVLLVNLFEIISGKKFPRYNKKPRMRIQKLENLTAVIAFVKAQGIKLVNVGPDDIEEGNIKIILGLLWSTILRFQISCDDDGNSPKRGLLDWVNKQIAPYERDGVTQVTNFTRSFQNGKALAALTDSLEPGCVDVKALSDPIRNCELAIDTAQENFGIPPIMDARDIVEHPDEHSMMTYISYFRDYLEKEGDSKRKAELEKKRLAEEAAARKAAAIERALKWSAAGPGLVKGWVSRIAPFVIKSDQGDAAEASEFQIMAKHSAESIMGDVQDGSDPRSYDARYLPHHMGDYEIVILLDNEPIAGSPYKVPVFESAIAGNSWAEGPGLVSARDDKPAHFTVFARDNNNEPVSGEDAMEIMIDYDDGKNTVSKVDVVDNKDGSYSVTYEATKPGELLINVTIYHKSIKDMPLTVRVQNGKDLDSVCHEINQLRKGLGLSPRDFSEEELNSPTAEDDLTKERDDLRDIDKVCQDIQELHKKLGLPPREFTEDELTGTTAYDDRVHERSDLEDRLAQKELVDPLVDEIQKLRKAMDLPPREFTDEELTGPNAVADLTAERDHLKKIQPVHDEIHDLRKQLDLPRREFSENDLTGPQSYPERCDERDDLKNQLGAKDGTDPIVQEIQRLRKNLGLPPKEFTHEELAGPTALEDRTKERDDLKDVTDLVDAIQKLRKKLGLPPQEFTEEQLTGPTAIADLMDIKEKLEEMVPLYDDINDLRSKLGMPVREFTEDDLTGETALPDRTKERDELQDMLRRKNLCEPICAEIQRLRKKLDMPPREFTFEEMTGPTAVEDRTKERDQLKKILPITEDITDLRHKLEMPVREYEEAELAGPTAIADREKERDDLQDMWEKKQIIDPLCAEIQKLRRNLDLPKREFTEEELTGETAIPDRRKERDDLKAVTPLVGQIAELRKQLDMDKREYEEPELTGETAVPDRTAERDALLDKLGDKKLIDPLIKEIQALRKQMELEPRVFTTEELEGPQAIKDRMEERDALRSMADLFNQIQDLRKELDYPRREFTEEELTGPTSYPDRVEERDDLLDRLSRKKLVDPILREIQRLRKGLGLAPKEWTEDEMTGPTAIEDRTEERDNLKDVTDLCDEINKLRKRVDLPMRDFTEEELTGPTAVADRTEERDHLAEVVPICEDIYDLRKALEMEPREFDEDEVTGPTSIPDRTKERDALRDKLAMKKRTIPVCEQIQKLRKQLEMSPREFEEEEMTGPTAYPDRCQERDDLQEMLPIADDIHRLRRHLEMPLRDFEDDELYGPTALPDRKEERDGLLAKKEQRGNIDPLLAEIQKLRRNVELAPREFSEEETTGPDALAERTEERDQLKEVGPLFDEIQDLRRKLEMSRREFEEPELTLNKNAVPDRIEERDNLKELLERKKLVDPLVAQINKLRKRMDLPVKDYDEDELLGPTAVEDRTAERDQLLEVLPLHDEIQQLHRKLELGPRDFDEDELTHLTNAVPDRTEERDRLREQLARKKNLDPLMAQIQRLRKQLDIPPRVFTEDELSAPTAQEDLTEERDNLKLVVPLENEIQRLHKRLEMPHREFEEDELAGPTAVPDRTEERDNLLARLKTKKQVDPLIAQIQRLRKQLDLEPRDFDDDELFGPTAIEDRTTERDGLKEVLPVVGDIQRLHKRLGVPKREFEEGDLTLTDHNPDDIPGIVEDRHTEKERLEQIPPLADEIHHLRKELEMPLREFADEELVGPTNVEDRTKERDDLLEKIERMRALQPLIDELQGLRKQLGMPPREFEEGELDEDDADVKLQKEIDDLKKLLNRRDEADALAKEIQELRKDLDMPKRIFTEEELDSPEAVPKLTVERDDLLAEKARRMAVGDLPEQINRLRKKLHMEPKKFPDVIPMSMVPELIEERDDLQDECDRRRNKYDGIMPQIEKLWHSLDVPQSERPKLDCPKKEIPTLPLLSDCDDELARLKNLLRDQIKDKIAEQQALLDKLWQKLHVPEDAQNRFYRGIPDLYCAEGLSALQEEVERLHKMLLSSKKLIKLILKRKAFIQRMLEFEVVASDPRRLFKSSTQLNKEEEFRRSAYPTLLSLETAIRDGLEVFEEETGVPFEWEGEYYLVTLEHEIENRPDLTVFGVGGNKAGRKALQKTKIAATRSKTRAAKSSPGTKSTGTKRTTGVKKKKSLKSKGGLPPGFKSVKR